MIFIFGPLYSGKRDAAMDLLHCDAEELSRRAVCDVQDLAAEADSPAVLEALADRLARYDAVIATEVGGGVIPADRRERAAREAAGRLNILLADRASAVVRVFCGIPVPIRGELPGTEGFRDSRDMEFLRRRDMESSRCLRNREPPQCTRNTELSRDMEC